MADGHQKFGRLNRVATCRGCGKRTHSSSGGSVDIELCSECLDAAGWENAHGDEGHAATPNPACPICRKASPSGEGL